jgi:uncharacterized protein (DUF1330 family)
MSAYVIVDIDVTDPEGYKEYVRLAPKTVTMYGGRYLARGGSPVPATQVQANETLEGDWHAKRLVILEFENTVKAKAWLNSPEYAPVRALRHKYAKTNMVAVEGL